MPASIYLLLLIILRTTARASSPSRYTSIMSVKWFSFMDGHCRRARLLRFACLSASTRRSRRFTSPTSTPTFYASTAQNLQSTQLIHPLSFRHFGCWPRLLFSSCFAARSVSLRTMFSTLLFPKGVAAPHLTHIARLRRKTKQMVGLDHRARRGRDRAHFALCTRLGPIWRHTTATVARSSAFLCRVLLLRVSCGRITDGNAKCMHIALHTGDLSTQPPPSRVCTVQM